MTNRTSIIALLAAAMTFAVEGANTITVNASVDSHIGSVTVKAKVTSGTQTLGTVRSGERASWDAWGIGTAYTAEVENVSIGYTAKWKVSTNDVVAMTGGTNNTIELSSTAFSGCELSFYGEPIEYAVTLDRQSGSGGASSVRATYDAAMPPATMPTRTGYTFGGYWTEENGGGTQYYNADGSSTRAWDIDEARTLYAKWTANTYTVTLDPQSGSGGSPSVEATFDAAMPSAAMPTRDGYMFGGYYASPNGGGTQYYNADGTSARTWNIGEARTLYAKWMEAAFTVTLDPQGGSGGTESVTATYGRALPPITKPTRGGYKFNGYYEEVNGGGTQYYTSSGASLANSAFTSNTTIYAYWTQNPTVTFELNGGAFKSGSVWTTTTNYEEGVGLTLPAGSELTYPNHAFDGWYEYGVVDRVSSIGPSATGDKVFYAKWDEDYYWVTFDANDGSNHSGEQKLPMANTAWLKPVSELFSREGYGFTAWNTVANGSGEPYVDHAEISTSNSLTNVPYARVTLYAQWTPNPYEVAFQPNGADGGETMANQPFTYDVTQELDHVAFTYTGHAFKGWSTVTNKPSKVYLDGEGVANLATGGVVNLYANWTGVVYTVSFNANGGTGAMDPITCTYNVPTNLPPCSFERDGWGFKEWTNSLAPGVPFADGARVTNLTSRVEDVQLYACWTGSTYSVVLDAGTDVRGYGVMTNGVGDFVSVLTNDYVVGDTWILPSPTNANVHLDFAGWEYEDAQGTAHPAPAEVPPPSAGITNLMATWSWVPDDLAIAVDAPGLEFYTFGTWGAQGLSTESRTAAEWSDCICDGTNAVQSGTLPRAPGDGMKHVSWLILKTSGRGVLTFWWKCAAAARDQFEEQDEFGTDIVIKTGEAFHFGRYDGEGGGFVDLTTELEGVAEWQQVVYTNTNDGPVTFAWKFQYDSSNESQNGGGTGWVDRVTWTPEGGGNQEPPDPVVTQEVWTVTFDPNGGAGEMAAQTFTNGVEQALSPNAFTRAGYTFGGWATNAAEGAVYADGQGVTIATNTTLYASWVANTYMVAFDANGGEGEMAVLTNTYDLVSSLTSNAFTKSGCAFAGWATNETGDVEYADGAEVLNLTDVAGGTVTLYAQWTEEIVPPGPEPDPVVTQEVTFDANGGAGEMAPQTFTNGVEQALSPNAFTRAGYTFGGWATNAAEGAVYADGQGVTVTTNAVLYASWTPNAYTVAFAANGGEGEMADQAFTYDLVSCLTSNAFTKGGYTFAGWATNETGDVEYADGAEVLNLTDVAGGTVTLYAQWTEEIVPPGPGPEPDPVVTQEVTFDANGGAGEMAPQTFTNGVEQALSPNAFTRAGYTFGGWATNEAGDVVYTDGQSVAIATNTTLYASWVANTYVVVFDANGGEGEMAVLTNTYDLVSSLTSNAFTKSGCAFAGWATNETGAVEYADGAEVLNLTDVAGGTVTLYAQWTEEILPPGPDPEPVGEITFVESLVVADEVSNTNVVVRVSGGHAEKASSVKVYLTYNTAAAADLDLAHGSVGSVATALKFPLTLNWAAGEVGEKVITIPVKVDALVEGEEFFTLQLAAASGMELGEARICTVRIEDAQWPDGMSEADAQERVPPGATATTVKTVVDGVTNTVITGYFTKKNSKGNVTAKAMPGYVFVAWVYTKGGKTYSTKATITDKLRKSKKVQPKFAVARYVRALADPANGGKVTGSGKYAHGKTVTLKATPTKYWSFEGWYEISEGATVNNEEVGNGWRLRSKSRSWKVKATNDVTYVATFKPYPKVKLTVDKEFPGGTVKGAGSYLTGKKVTLKATPKKGYAFTGWWRVVVDAEGVCTTNRVSLSASYAYTVKADGVALIARFKKESALVKPTLTWGDYVVGGSAPDVHSTNLTVGVSYSAKLTVAGESVVSITKVTGLPKGLTYKSGKVSGVPTVKKVYTAKVTVALKSNAKKTWTYSVKLNVAALPGWAVGTFKGTLYDGEGEGAAAKGTVTMAVGKTGKISGKFVNTKKKSYAFSAASFKTYGDDGVLWTKAAMKYGSKSVALEIAVGSVERTGEDSSTIVVGIAEVRAAAAPFNGESAQLAK